MTDSTFTGNTAGYDGGAIDSGDGEGGGPGTGSVSVTGSTFTGNDAHYNGGAIDSGTQGGGGSVSVTGSTFTGNRAGDGGAIDSGDYAGHGSVSVTASAFTSNFAYYDGGAIDGGDDFGAGSVSVTASTFSGNTAESDGGAIDSGDSPFGTGHGDIFGGGSVSVTASTFSGNTADFDGGAIDSGDNRYGGGGRGGGSVRVTTSTFSGNTASVDGGAIDSGDNPAGQKGRGGGSVRVTASTFSGNTASVDGGLIDSGDTSGAGSVLVAADVFAGSCDQAGGTWVDHGDSAGSDGTCFQGGTRDVNAGSVPALDLQAGLTSNGGPTQTIAPTTGSPAIGVIPSPTARCPATDQRGYASAPGSACDAGAVQTSGTVRLALVDSAAPGGFRQAGDQISYTYTVINFGTTALAGITVTDRAVPSVSCPDAQLAAGASETCTGSHTVTSANVTAGKVTDTATATGTPPLGGGTVSSNRSTVTVREAWPAVLSGTYQPAPGAAEGYYLGVTGSYLGGATSSWQMLVTQPGPGTVKFTGTITINHGKFTHFTRLSMGRGTAKASGNTITFSITNSGQLNGFKFATPAAATSIIFTLDISAAPAAAGQLYLGSTPTQASGPSPFTYNR